MTWLWTAELTEKARRLFIDEGHSARVVAQMIGAPSRHSVVGRLWRAGYRLEKSERARRTGRPDQSRAPRKPPEKRYSPPKTKPMSPELLAKPQGRPLSLMELSHHTCRWPTGDGPQWGFCGARTDEGPYCCEHRARAYVPGRSEKDFIRSVRRYA